MNFPKRTQQHRTDTLAMKKVGVALGDDLLIRSIDERDYGVDAMVELYEVDSVGQMIFLQVKGTDADINPLQSVSSGGKQMISLGGFPKKTLMYAEQFVHPFIVAYTSVKNGAKDASPVYFLWLQRYIERVMDANNPDWRISKLDTVTLHFEYVNLNVEKNLKNLAKLALREAQSMRLMRINAYLDVLSLSVLPAVKKNPVDVETIKWVLRGLRRCPLAIEVGDKNMQANFESSFNDFNKEVSNIKDKYTLNLCKALTMLRKATAEIVALILLQGTAH